MSGSSEIATVIRAAYSSGGMVYEVAYRMVFHHGCYELRHLHHVWLTSILPWAETNNVYIILCPKQTSYVASKYSSNVNLLLFIGHIYLINKTTSLYSCQVL